MHFRDSRKKISIYINKKDRYQGKKLYKLIMQTIYELEASGCSIFLTAASYGSDYHIRYQGKFTFSRHRGLEIVVIETEKKAQQIIEKISPIIPNGLITIENIEMIRFSKAQPTAEDQQLIDQMSSNR